MNKKSQSKFYGSFLLTVDDYKENGMYQFNLNTAIPVINTNKDFSTPEEAFKYADQIIKDEFHKILLDIDNNIT